MRRRSYRPRLRTRDSLPENSIMDITRGAALRRGVRLEVATIAWMLVEAVIALAAGIAAHSVLLTAFGADSVIELLSGIVLYVRLSAESAGTSRDVERLEATTTRVSAGLLVVLCGFGWLAFVARLVLRITPSDSVSGASVTPLALLALPLPCRGQPRV